MNLLLHPVVEPSSINQFKTRLDEHLEDTGNYKDGFGPHSTTPTPTPTPTRPTRLHPYVRHARFPREEVGVGVRVGVVECGIFLLPSTFVHRPLEASSNGKWRQLFTEAFSH